MTGAKVSVKNAKAEDKQPQVVILGRKDAVAKAKEQVLAKLPIVGRLEILESEVGAVIGQKGKGIRELEQRTGATISVVRGAGQRRTAAAAAATCDARRRLSCSRCGSSSTAGRNAPVSPSRGGYTHLVLQPLLRSRRGTSFRFSTGLVLSY